MSANSRWDLIRSLKG